VYSLFLYSSRVDEYDLVTAGNDDGGGGVTIIAVPVAMLRLFRRRWRACYPRTGGIIRVNRRSRVAGCRGGVRLTVFARGGGSARNVTHLRVSRGGDRDGLVLLHTRRTLRRRRRRRRRQLRTTSVPEHERPTLSGARFEIRRAC